MWRVLLITIVLMVESLLMGCTQTAVSSPAQSSYQPEYGYVTSAYSYPEFNYYPTRPSRFDTHGAKGSKK